MTAIEDVCWALAHECRHDDVLIVGVATPIAAAAAFVARELLVRDLTIIMGGTVDPPATDVAALLTDPFAVSRAAEVTLGQGDLLTLLQRGTITLQFVSPAQVDMTGAINTSRVRSATGAWKRLPGCLALPDTAALVGRLVAYRIDGGDRFLVDTVDHRTGMGTDTAVRTRFGLSGAGVTAVITEQGRLTINEIDGISGPATPLPHMPAEVATFLAEVVDPHGVLGLETRHARAEAGAALARFAGAAS